MLMYSLVVTVWLYNTGLKLKLTWGKWVHGSEIRVGMGQIGNSEFNVVHRRCSRLLCRFINQPTTAQLFL
jgi:hypothetical protein